MKKITSQQSRNHIVYFNDKDFQTHNSVALCGITVEANLKIYSFNKTNISKLCLVCFKLFFEKIELKRVREWTFERHRIVKSLIGEEKTQSKNDVK